MDPDLEKYISKRIERDLAQIRQEAFQRVSAQLEHIEEKMERRFVRQFMWILCGVMGIFMATQILVVQQERSKIGEAVIELQKDIIAAQDRVASASEGLATLQANLKGTEAELATRMQALDAIIEKAKGARNP